MSMQRVAHNLASCRADSAGRNPWNAKTPGAKAGRYEYITGGGEYITGGTPVLLCGAV
ncbi:MAG: hypothetical protein IT366_24520 [Candidatus Hydrogenedentes bacterium]|nr:hypothetical protein [Candidatus Hydrogenedentota bacterium]